MKKTIMPVLVLIIIMAVAMPGCGSGAAGSRDNGSGIGNSDGGRVSVVATIFAPYDFARAIAGDRADVTMLLPPGSESHSFEPTPQDTITVQDCDVFIYVGGDSDAWVDRILDSMDTGNMQVVTLMDCVDLVEEELKEGMEEDDEGEGDEEEGDELDEHVWTSPRNAKLIVQKISDAICEADAKNASYYKDNTSAYLKKLDELDAAFRGVVDGAARKTMIFADRFPFRYFADAYGLDYFAAFPGCSTETEPSAKTVAFLVDKVKDEQIPVVFHIELSNEKMADVICEATGAKKRLLHACHNVSKEDFESGATYLSLMTKNIEPLREALR